MNTPSPELLKDVRAELVRRGTSLKAFCERHGFVWQHVGQVVAGKRHGPKASSLVAAFLEKLSETE
jgi:lambda repressor-like predicted transcriptional regulator